MITETLMQARQSRDLGSFQDSIRHYEQAMYEKPEDMSLIVEVAGMKMQQTLIGDCYDMLTELKSRIDSNPSGLDAIHLAKFDQLFALSAFTATLKFGTPLRRAETAYERFAHDKPVESFDGSIVSVASAYHCLLTQANIMYYQHENPPLVFTPEFQARLVNYLLLQKRYDDGIMIAKLCNFSQESSDNRTLLQMVLAEDDLSDLQRAEVLWEYADKVRLADGEGWKESLVIAAELYHKAGHASGALDIQVDLIRYDGSEGDIAQHTAELWQINERMQAVGNWASASRCLYAIIDIHTHDGNAPSAALLAKVEEEWITVSDFRLGDLTGPTIITVLEWQSTQSKTARGLEYLENLYEKIADADVPIIIAQVLTRLHDTYKDIGNDDKANEYISKRPEILPRVLTGMWETDTFQTALNATQSAMEATKRAMDTESELKALRHELSNVRIVINSTPDLGGRVTELQRLSNIYERFISQHEFRGHKQLEQVVTCINSVIEEACQSFDDNQARIWRATALDHRAKLLKVALLRSTDMDDYLRLTAESVQYQKQAVQLFNGPEYKRSVHAANAKTYLAIDCKLLWKLQGRPADSDDFKTAATMLAEATEVGSLEQRQKRCLLLLKLWYDDFETRIKRDKENIDKATSRDTIIRWANEADRLARIERNNLSALTREKAVLAKQRLSRKASEDDFHKIAIALHDQIDDGKGIWNWLQKSKARSISDMLGLGITLPAALKNQIESDHELMRMCDEEKKMVNELENISDDLLFLKQHRLESYRDEMRTKPPLKQLLEYREGQTTSLERLGQISVTSSPESTRSIFYVDWFVFEGLLMGVILPSLSLELTFFPTGITIAQVTDWKAAHLGNGSLDSPDLNPLRQLSGLVTRIVPLTKAGDILVFCPADVLHGVPLHAMVVETACETVLLERNPVVYTASMTTFEQCVSKEAERGSSERQPSRSYIAVYERLADGQVIDKNSSRRRDELYTEIREIAAKRQPCSVALGNEVKVETLVSALESDYTFFFGHCESPGTDALKQRLCLGLRGQQAEGDERTGDGGIEDIEEVFTASDMFDMDIKASCVTLLACASATQLYSQGDEPLGITSALLCAGATSIIGTMWPVQLNHAAYFLRILDVQMNEEQKNNSVVDLAVATQAAALELKSRPEGGTNFVSCWASFVLHGSWYMSKRTVSDSESETVPIR